jgi:NTP pyrophosphatase (non-canonical NTP hydrolase)
MQVSEMQRVLRDTYIERDTQRGSDATFRWLTEEVGELAKALRGRDDAELEHEFSDVLAWLMSLASLTGVDLEQAMGRYARGCPRCGSLPCGCPFVR